MSAILKQLEEYKEAAKISAEFSDLVSVEELAAKTGKEIQSVKEILKDENIKPVGKLGKSYLYSKKELLKVIKQKVA